MVILLGRYGADPHSLDNEGNSSLKQKLGRSVNQLGCTDVWFVVTTSLAKVLEVRMYSDTYMYL